MTSDPPLRLELPRLQLRPAEPVPPSAQAFVPVLAPAPPSAPAPAPTQTSTPRPAPLVLLQSPPPTSIVRTRPLHRRDGALGLVLGIVALAVFISAVLAMQQGLHS